MWNSGVKRNSSVRSIRTQVLVVTLTIYLSTGTLLCCHVAVVLLSSLQIVAIPTYHTLMPWFSTSNKAIQSIIRAGISEGKISNFYLLEWEESTNIRVYFLK